MKFATSQKLAVIILAAGASKRLGRPKQLLSLNGQTLLEGAIMLGHSVTEKDVFVVSGAYRDSLAPIIKSRQATELHNPSWRKGIGSSVSFAASELEKHYAAMLFLTTDQYMIKPAALKAMVALWLANPSKIITACYQGHQGIPCLFPKAWFCELKKCDKDFGARHIIKNAGKACLAFALPEAAKDLDTPEDLKNVASAGEVVD